MSKRRRATAERWKQAIGLEWVLGEYRALAGHADGRLDRFLHDVRDRAPGPVAIADEWARVLAFALVQASRLIDPNRIVLGGLGGRALPDGRSAGRDLLQGRPGRNLSDAGNHRGHRGVGWLCFRSRMHDAPALPVAGRTDASGRRPAQSNERSARKFRSDFAPDGARVHAAPADKSRGDVNGGPPVREEPEGLSAFRVGMFARSRRRSVPCRVRSSPTAS